MRCPQLASLLLTVQAEQSRLREQFAAQSSTVSQLQSDILAARQERDAARAQLERVQRLLAATPGASGSRIPLPPLHAEHGRPCSPGLNLDALAITTVLPAPPAATPGGPGGAQAAGGQAAARGRGATTAGRPAAAAGRATGSTAGSRKGAAARGGQTAGKPRGWA